MGVRQVPGWIRGCPSGAWVDQWVSVRCLGGSVGVRQVPGRIRGCPSGAWVDPWVSVRCLGGSVGVRQVPGHPCVLVESNQN